MRQALSRIQVDAKDAIAVFGMGSLASGVGLTFSVGVALIVVGVVLLGAVAWGAR